MAGRSEEYELDLILNAIRRTGRLTEDQKETLTKAFGGRFIAAVKALEDGKVKKYVFHPGGRNVWIVNGKERDYLIRPLANFCSCLDFYFRVIGRETDFCYHLIAQKLADATGEYRVIDEDDARFSSLMKKWLEFTVLKRELSAAEIESIRKVVSEILREYRELPIEKILDEMKGIGFTSLDNRHLANILIADKAKRFKCANGLWTLSSDSVK